MLKCETHEFQNVIDFALWSYCYYLLTDPRTCLTDAEEKAFFENVPSGRRHNMWAPSSEFVSSSIPSWQVLTAHAQPFREARDLAFCLKVPLDSMLVWASSRGSGETARMRRLAWTFAARIGDKYQIRLTRSMWCQKIGTVKTTFFIVWKSLLSVTN